MKLMFPHGKVNLFHSVFVTCNPGQHIAECLDDFYSVNGESVFYSSLFKNQQNRGHAWVSEYGNFRLRAPCTCLRDGGQRTGWGPSLSVRRCVSKTSNLTWD